MKENPPTKANVKQCLPFFWVRNIERSLRYYTEGLGFQKAESWVDEGKIRWCQLELDDVAIMLQEFWTEGHHNNLPDGKLGVGITIVFLCEDALNLYEQFLDRGIEVSEPFVGNGMWVVNLTDPDGYQLMFESKTDLPEEIRLGEWKQGNSQ
ncbi:MAG: VOC family protein [Bacteroidota bacterium]